MIMHYYVGAIDLYDLQQQYHSDEVCFRAILEIFLEVKGRYRHHHGEQ